MSLHELQTKVHVAKDKRNDFGGYNYRTAEGILAAIKAALPPGASIVVSDEMQEVAGQIFVSATALITFEDGTTASASGHAMHPLSKKGMDPSQITGAASSYARKYALAGLVALDDGSVDPDARKEDYQPEPKREKTPDEQFDWFKQVIESKTDAARLEEFWNREDVKEYVRNLPEGLRTKLTAIHSQRMAELSEPTADEMLRAG